MSCPFTSKSKSDNTVSNSLRIFLLIDSVYSNLSRTIATAWSRSLDTMPSLTMSSIAESHSGCCEISRYLRIKSTSDLSLPSVSNTWPKKPPPAISTAPSSAGGTVNFSWLLVSLIFSNLKPNSSAIIKSPLLSFIYKVKKDYIRS